MLFRREKRKMVQVKEQEIDQNGKKEWENNDIVSHDKKFRERKRSHKTFRLLFAPMSRGLRKLCGRASFCSSFQTIRKASLAVETAMVLPVFFLGMVTIISFMDVYKLQTEHLMKLCERTKEAGMYAYMPNSNGMEEVTLCDIYSYEPIGGIVPLPKVWMNNTVKVHAWTGKEYKASEDGEQLKEEMVYVTDSGQVYHKHLSCSYLNVSVSQIGGKNIASMKNAYGEKYEACEICSPNQKPGGTVYIAQKGNRYHNLASCSGLKRTVRMVKISNIEGMAACSRCG